MIATDRNRITGTTLSIEKAILADVCLGIPLGYLTFEVPAHLDAEAVEPAPNTFLLRGQQLALMRWLYNRGDERITTAVNHLKVASNDIVAAGTPSVIDKERSTLSVDPHDYQSLAKYWHPNPNSPDGLPYTRKDGVINPGCYDDQYDNLRLVRFSEHLTTLALTAFLSSNDGYGGHAAAMLKTWFLSPATRQTPHFEFSQRVIGRDRQRWQGVIEARNLIYVTEAARLLKSIGHLDGERYSLLQQWFRELLNWMNHSPIGVKAAAAQNNIGHWFDLQRIVYAAFCDESEQVSSIFARSALPRIRAGIEPDGAMPLELSRAYPQDYVAFSLAAMAMLSQAGQRLGVDAWITAESEGKSFQAARDWFLRTSDVGTLLGALQRDAADSSRQLPEGALIGEMFAAALEARIWRRVLTEANKPLEIQLRRLEDQHRELVVECKRLRSHSRRINSRLDETLSSTSWLLTAPLRWIVELVRGNSGRPNTPAVPTPDLWRLDELLRFPGRESSSSPPTNEACASVATRKPPIKDKVEQRKEKKQLSSGPNARAKELRRLLGPESTPANYPANSTPLTLLQNAKVREEPVLIADYNGSSLKSATDTYVLYRIIGNDLVPRHKKGQSRQNLRFMLEWEPELDACEKRWVVNRVFDPDEEQRIMALLEAHGQNYLRIPFSHDEYRAVGWDFDALPEFPSLPEKGLLQDAAFFMLDSDRRERLLGALYRLKNLYVMHNNGARNAALEDGRTRAKWVLPWDGNCFVSAAAWRLVRDSVESRPHLPVFIVPMERITNNDDLLSEGYEPHPVEEPQILFRQDFDEKFDVRFPYGRRPKVELFWRLGVPGPWDSWKDDLWDQARLGRSKYYQQFGVAGWVARLSSGMKHLERDRAGAKSSFKARGKVRRRAILDAIDLVDQKVYAAEESKAGNTAWSRVALERAAAALEDDDPGPLGELTRCLVGRAEQQMQGEPYSVTRKTTLPPSGDAHDYWHPAPYWWPNAEAPDGLPYVRRDGQRVPGTVMYEQASEQYDRTALQLMFDGTTYLALAAQITGEEAFANRAVDLIRTWFVDSKTRMNPHLRYAQVRRGHNNDEGTGTGIIELKDFYYVLDALRLLEDAGAIPDYVGREFRAWLEEYGDWLETSPQGAKERSATNNHGTYYDLQIGAIACYLGQTDRLRQTLMRAQARLFHQITAAGEQPEEMKRTMTQHYCFYNLQGWLNILLLGRSAGMVLLNIGQVPLSRVRSAVRWVLSHDLRAWPYQQIARFEPDRGAALALSASRLFGADAPELPEIYRSIDYAALNPTLNPHHAVQPFWNLTPF